MSWNQWYCSAINSRTRKPVRGEAFVRAANRRNAEKCGELALRQLGVKGRIRVLARPYFPWIDPAFGHFIGPAR